MTSKTQKNAVAEQIWLLYFNRYLYERGIITEKERNKMIHSITSRKSIPISR